MTAVGAIHLIHLAMGVREHRSRRVTAGRERRTPTRPADTRAARLTRTRVTVTPPPLPRHLYLAPLRFGDGGMVHTLRARNHLTGKILQRRGRH